MTATALFQVLLLFAATLVLMVPLGGYIARLLTGSPLMLEKIGKPFEATLIQVTGGATEGRQSWLTYAVAVLGFNALGILVLALELAFQNQLPLNPRHLPGLSWDLALNVAVSFVTNTDWQAYNGEQTLSYFSQMVGLTVENFLSAATGLAVAAASIRGFVNRESASLGNFYKDVTRGTLYLLLPLAVIFSLFLIWQGTPDNFKPYAQAVTLEGGSQTIPQGPVASQAAIKMLGSNGGGYFNANGAHPYENPTPLSNFVEMISILLLPGAIVIAFGRMVGDQRQGWALMSAMTILILIIFGAASGLEGQGNPGLTPLGVDQVKSQLNPGGNMEGKETRFGPVTSTLWATLTTATSNGATSSAHDSFTPLAGAALLFNMLVGGVIFGGIGCGLYGILIYVLLTVFIAGLMVGRTPEYLGKKIESYEIKLAVVAMLIYPLSVLGIGVLALLIPSGAVSISAPGPHGLTQVIYAYASAAANNGSAFAGFNGDTLFQNVALAVVMLIGRYGMIIPILAIAGSLARKKTIPSSSGTFPTHSPTFVLLLIGVIIMFGGLTYFPAVALGPLVEQLALTSAGSP